MSNAVEHPSYYNKGQIEVKDAIESWGYGEGFFRGCAIKYIARAGAKSKETEIEDLQKAMEYIKFEIERLEKANESSL